MRKRARSTADWRHVERKDRVRVDCGRVKELFDE